MGPSARLDARGTGDFGTFIVQSAGSQRSNDQFPVPWVMMSGEQYNRLVRLVDMGKEPELELNIETKFHDDDLNAYNTIAEIPGTDKKGEVVMLGAHLDSWHGGTGATDNGAGSVVAMEVMRVLKAIGIAPKRTIRIGLWSGEEQGLLGVARLCLAAFRLTAGAAGGRARHPDLAAQEHRTADHQAGAREAGRLFQYG